MPTVAFELAEGPIVLRPRRHDDLDDARPALQDRGALRLAEEHARGNSEEFTRAIGGAVVDVGEFDLVLAHPCLPEME